MPVEQSTLKNDLESAVVRRDEQGGVVPRGTFATLADKHLTTRQNVGQTAKRLKIRVERGKN